MGELVIGSVLGDVGAGGDYLRLLAEVRQAFGAQEFLELGIGEEPVFQDQFSHALAGGKCFLRDGSGGGVAEVGIQCGDQADGLLHSSAQVFGVGRDSTDAAGREGAAGCLEVGDA